MRGKLRWLLPLVAIPFLGLLAYGLGRDTYVLPSPLVSEAAPPFRLETLDGDSLALADFEGRIVLLNFWASWCLPCREEHGVLLRTAQTWPDSEVAVVGVVYQDSRENAARFLREMGGGWTQLLDPSTRVGIDYGVYGVPETFFLNPKGEISFKQVGPVTWDLVRTKVDSLLAAGSGPVPATLPDPDAAEASAGGSS
ncbi:MAG: TlpA family protein disulfide reductase [Gemmatimonadota bacterium]